MAIRLLPVITADDAFFWNGLRQHKLLIQCCASCATLRHPPRPMCSMCNSLDWDTIEASGRGTIYSYVMPQHPRFPFFEYPYIVALVELAEGVRLVSNLCDIAPQAVKVGLAVEVFYRRFDNDVVLHQFRPAR
jgi:uncharacterized OB-fold protein